MTHEPLGVRVMTDAPVPGIADRVDALASEADDVTSAVERTDRLWTEIIAGDLDSGAIQDEVDDLLRLLHELDASPTRRLPQVVKRIMSRLRGRRLVDDLGEVESTIDLFGLHVPLGGSAAVELHRSAATRRQVSIRAMGLGYGGGRKLSVAIDEDIPERTVCMRVLQHVVLKVGRFAAGDDSTEPIVMTDVIRWGVRELVAWPDCTYCRASGDDLSRLEFEEDAALALDLRGFDTPVTRRTSFTLEGSRKLDVGVDLTLSGADTVSAGFSFEQQTSISCTATYTFPPGRCFVPYRLRGDSAAFPYWATR